MESLTPTEQLFMDTIDHLDFFTCSAVWRLFPDKTRPWVSVMLKKGIDKKYLLRCWERLPGSNGFDKAVYIYMKNTPENQTICDEAIRNWKEKRCARVARSAYHQRGKNNE